MTHGVMIVYELSYKLYIGDKRDTNLILGASQKVHVNKIKFLLAVVCDCLSHWYTFVTI